MQLLAPLWRPRNPPTSFELEAGFFSVSSTGLLAYHGLPGVASPALPFGEHRFKELFGLSQTLLFRGPINVARAILGDVMMAVTITDPMKLAVRN